MPIGRARSKARWLTDAGPVSSDRLETNVDSLVEAAERMRRIVHGLSTYGKPQRVDPTLVSLPELLTALTELIAYAARNANVKVVRHVPDSLPHVLADRSQVMQILLNLANNALEAMAPAGGMLTLAGYVEDEPPTIVAEIADTGPGIPPEQLEGIWTAFYTTKAEGTGLGLSIVRALVAEQPGATISVRSTIGRGTVFSLAFPASPS